MKTKQGEDRSVLKSKLADLEQEWEGVCQMSIARQQRLENASKKVRPDPLLIRKECIKSMFNRHCI